MRCAEADDAHPAPPVSDEAFAAIVEEMVTDFESAEFEAVVDQMVADFASDPMPAMGGAGEDFDEVAAFEQRGRGENSVAAEPAHDIPADSVALGAPARDRRLARAVRLTGEALKAWTSLLQGPAVVSLRP